MGDEQHCFAVVLPDPQQFILQQVAGLQVQRAEWFVHKQDIGAHRQSAGDADTLLHAAGQLVRVGLGEAGQADEVDVLAGDFETLAFRTSLHFQAERHVLQRRSPWEQIEALEHHGSSGAGAGDAVSVDLDAAAIGLVEPVQDTQESGFAAAAGADDRNELQVGDVEGQVLEYCQPALGEAAGQLGGAQLGRRHRRLDRRALFQDLGHPIRLCASARYLGSMILSKLAPSETIPAFW